MFCCVLQTVEPFSLAHVSLTVRARTTAAVCDPRQVYDLMTKLAELAVTSHRPTLRATSGQTFLTFLLHYPLGEKRLQFHLNQVRR